MHDISAESPLKQQGKRAGPVIRLQSVALTYPGPPQVCALRPTDLTIEAGDYVAVVGPSGSGKSTLLNILGLLDRPTSGTYELDGKDVGGLTDGRRTSLRGTHLGFVFQAFHLMPHRSALDNVALAQLYTGTKRRDREQAALAALDRVGLSHRIDALPTTLSGGERQRVAIARALAVRPSLLLCDEPTGNLDTQTGATVLDLLGNLHLAGMTLIVVTHDAGAADRAERVLRMRDGVLTEA